MELDLMHNPHWRTWAEVENPYTAASLVAERMAPQDKGATELTGHQWATIARALAHAADPDSGYSDNPEDNEAARNALAAICDSIRITLID